MPEVAVVVVTYQSAATIADCLASLPEGVVVRVVDNASADETVALVRARFPAIEVSVLPENVGFGAACNQGAALTDSEHLLFLNPDAALEPGALDCLVAAMDADPLLGAVGPLILETDGRHELSWGDDPGLYSEWKRSREQTGRAPRPAPPVGRTSVEWVSGGCMLVRRAAWADVGGFDPGYFLYFEDADLCRRLRREGWQVAFEPLARVRHGRGESARQAPVRVATWYRESQARYYARHRAWPEQVLLRLYLMLKPRKAAP